MGIFDKIKDTVAEHGDAVDQVADDAVQAADLPSSTVGQEHDALPDHQSLLDSVGIGNNVTAPDAPGDNGTDTNDPSAGSDVDRLASDEPDPA